MTPLGMTPLGMTVPFEGFPLREQLSMFASLTTGGGYTDLWTSEVGGIDAFTPLVAAAASPGSTARLGTAIVPAFTRGPATIAMQAASLCELAPGRVALGIGSSSNVIVESWNGIPFEQPLARTRDLLRFLRGALAGERVTMATPSFDVSGFRLEVVPEQAPPILVAALREGMLRLAGREADGVLLNWLSADDVRTVKALVDQAADGAPREVVTRIFVCPIEDREAALTAGRRWITTYLNVPVYADYMRWLGRDEVLEPMWSAWAAGDRKAALTAVPESLVDELVLSGTPAQCMAGVQRYVDAGVTTPVLRFVGVSGADCFFAAQELAAVST